MRNDKDIKNDYKVLDLCIQAESGLPRKNGIQEEEQVSEEAVWPKSNEMEEPGIRIIESEDRSLGDKYIVSRKTRAPKGD